jgi:hypothetical protein
MKGNLSSPLHPIVASVGRAELQVVGKEFRSSGHIWASPFLFFVWCLTFGRSCQSWRREERLEWVDIPQFMISRPRRDWDSLC